ncbi:nucleotidyl transferase AbiEii/AbiGii toxin family protein [Streptomyces rimosus]|uniref:nucleotidyl transferase AbiEii/AbiGii toxin family protein n=1 Tax=Streptomyces rimosus TaxID=1927 RepID=UPI00067BACE0|nr:nucleotidyl transferase AbiEii/AbiGii toxin family protein [Streptomyces rimosus]
MTEREQATGLEQEQATERGHGERVRHWRDFGYGPWPATAVVPTTPPDEATRAAMDLPATLLPVRGEGVVQPPVFDPSVRQHLHAMRLGEPRFADAAAGRRWYAARRHALHHALTAVATSEWAGHLVLRGSVLLRAWFGAAAREPGDLDFVVVPPTWNERDGRTDRMLDGIARAAGELSLRGGPVHLHADGAVGDEIWTYDRVPGRRLVIPWTAHDDGIPPGTVQLDFVFNEHLPEPPAPAEVPGPDGMEPARVQAATPALSLAWKILWLVSDRFPEGKDLYDAVLLAESTELPFPLLRAVFRGVEGGYYDRNPVLLPSIAWTANEQEWDEFRKDHPEHAAPTEYAYVDRLVTALAPTYAFDDGSGASPAYQQRAAWLAPLTEECREVLAGQGMEAVQQLLLKDYVSVDNALVVTAELLEGPLDDRLTDAARAVASYRVAHAGPYDRERLVESLHEAVRTLVQEGD